MFDQIREPRKSGVNRTILLGATVLVLGVFLGLGYGSLWLLAKFGITVGPRPPVEITYEPFETRQLYEDVLERPPAGEGVADPAGGLDPVPGVGPAGEDEKVPGVGQPSGVDAPIDGVPEGD